MTTVSIIMPTHNRAHVLGRAIKSVLAQTFTNFELIIVDDGSTDNTQEIVESFNDLRIRFIRHERNRGVCAARNTGIRASRGEYITFLDSDDEFTPAKLQEQISALGHRNGSEDNIVVTGVLYLNDDKTSAQRNTGKIVLRPCLSGDIYEVFFAARRSSPLDLNSMMVRREYLDEAGLFDEMLRASEFWDLGVRLAMKHRFQVIEVPLYIIHRDAGVRTWNSDNRLQATPRLLEKYHREFASHPKAAANLKLVMGVIQLGRGLHHEGRQSILEALRMYPYSPKIYVHFLGSILPSTLYGKLAGKGFRYILGFNWLLPSLHSLWRRITSSLSQVFRVRVQSSSKTNGDRDRPEKRKNVR